MALKKISVTCFFFFVQDVTFAEAGVYRCIVTMNSLAQETSAVELIVKRNYDNEWDDEFKVRFFLNVYKFHGIFFSPIYALFTFFNPPCYGRIIVLILAKLV